MIKQMIRENQLAFITLLSIIIICTSSVQKDNSTVLGIWVSHTKEGFTVMEIKPNFKAEYTYYLDREKALTKEEFKEFKNTPFGEPYFYKSTGKWLIDNKNLRVFTNLYRFDFKINPNSLIEFDKTGNKQTFRKVQVDK